MRTRVLLIGGSGYKPYLAPLDDVWQFDLKAEKWGRLKPGKGTPAGGSRRAAPGPGWKVAYLFGGYGAKGKPNNELYRVDYSEEVPAFAAVQGGRERRAMTLRFLSHSSGRFDQRPLTSASDGGAGRLHPFMWR